MSLNDDLHGALTRFESFLDDPKDGEWIGRMQQRFTELSGPLREQLKKTRRGPIYGEIPVAKPRLSGRVDELRDGLNRIREELGEISESARTLSGDDIAEATAFRRRTRAFIDLLRDHDRLEIELLQSAYWREVGGSD